MSTISDIFLFTPEKTLLTKEFLCGVELEIEDIKQNDVLHNKIFVEHDHSLRNNGLEFKYGPVSFDSAIEFFKLVHSKLKLGPNPFTERTSIHVHINVLPLLAQQARELVLLYALCEPLYFNFVGPKRQNNIFCVPLNYTALPNVYSRDIVGMHKAWSKYTAFNISPMGPGKDGSAPHGTIEFRHLYGTADVKIFTTWLNALRDLYSFVVKAPEFTLLDYLENKGDPVLLIRDVVPTLANELGDLKIKNLIQDSLLDVKLASGGLLK